jgi:hypothetical protein
MCGSLMMGMVPGMLDHLGLSQSADGKDAEHQEDRDEFEDSVVHLHFDRMCVNVCQSNPNGDPLGLSSGLPKGLCSL